MREPNDSRDIGPRIGSPPWIYSAVVTVAGLGVLVLAARSLSLPAAADLAGDGAAHSGGAMALPSASCPD